MMVKNYFPNFAIIFTLLCTGLASCNSLNPPEIIPAYMHISSIHLDTLGGQGTNSNYITDAWVYVDNNPVGVFQMPCTFPIVASNGTHKLTVFAGIMQYGIAGDRAKYPFYAAYQANVTLTGDQVLTVKPNVWYTSWTKFHWMEDFEGGSISRRNNTIPGNYYSDTTMFQTSA